MIDNKTVNGAMTIKLDNEYPEYPEFEPGIRRAPDRGFRLTKAQTRIALKNALRYVPEELHEKLAPEFLEELTTRGRIYAYRYRPAGRIYGKPISEYKGKCLAGKAFQVMIDNNLDFEVALYPYELVTYGETGSVCQNWLQYRLIKKYLEELTEDQTLVVESGHPLGLFPSKPTAPRVIITNSMMVGMYDNIDDWEIAEEMGVANYGQMTAGGWMYIGPQGIVHGTFNTILNAGRKYLGVPEQGDLTGHTFVSSGLGGMSGFAEVDMSRIKTRHDQGWVDVVMDDIDQVFALAKEKLAAKESISIAYHGNIVDLLEAAVDRDFHIDLLSDQTSCHNVYDGGYCPCGMTFEERTRMLHEDRELFHRKVDETLHRHFKAIKALTERGTYFFDYGNSFMKAMYDAGIKEISKNGYDDKDGFIWPSYVEDIMGPVLFDYGYGPFRWVCLSGKPEDLDATDQAAMDCIDPNRRAQDRDALWEPYYLQEPCEEDAYDSFRDNKYVVVRKGYEHPEIVMKIISVLFDYTRYEADDAEEVNDYFALNVDPTARPLVINVDYNEATYQVTEEIREALKGDLPEEEMSAMALSPPVSRSDILSRRKAAATTTGMVTAIGDMDSTAAMPSAPNPTWERPSPIME